jgi:dTDP-4-dehydrorhamnose reductase
VTLALQALAAGERFAAPDDLVVSPTYVPDLVQTCLDLLIDREYGIWHLSNGEALSWHQLAQRVCLMAGIDAEGLQACPTAAFDGQAAQPRFSALGSERGILMPTLDDALARYLQAASGPVESGAAQKTHYGGS